MTHQAQQTLQTCQEKYNTHDQNVKNELTWNIASVEAAGVGLFDHIVLVPAIHRCLITLLLLLLHVVIVVEMITPDMLRKTHIMPLVVMGEIYSIHEIIS